MGKSKENSACVLKKMAHEDIVSVDASGGSDGVAGTLRIWRP